MRYSSEDLHDAIAKLQGVKYSKHPDAFSAACALGEAIFELECLRDLVACLHKQTDIVNGYHVNGEDLING